MIRNPAQSRGFVSSPTTFIRQIRNNLEEGRYERDASGFTIFKELLQNADDAGPNGASFVHFGISNGLPNAEHPLLRAPALYVVNDGPFERQDEKNILRFGENSKSLDSTKIGKFGLGLKSLFHLCEAFFYFYFVEKDGKRGLRRGLLNPWSSGEEGDLHPEWDDLVADDIKIVVRELSPFFQKRECFSLWVPLRQHAHLNGKHPITKFFPGDHIPNWFLDSELPGSIQSVLPLLKNVSTVRGFNGSGASASEAFCIEIPIQCGRRSDIAKLKRNDECVFGGIVTGKGHDEVSYHVIETLRDDQLLRDLQASESWPDDEGLDPQTGQSLQVKEKAELHGACCVSIARRTGPGTGSLSIGWAVFLPLGTPEMVPLDLPFDVSINIHGYFFTDAGRNGPLGLTKGFIKPHGEAEERLVKARWNYRLAEVASLPLLPETISRAMHESSFELPDALPAAITRGIANSPLFQQASDAICSKHCWGVTGDAVGSVRWQLHKADRRMLLLPGEATSGAMAWSLFPRLDELSKEFVISFDRSPRLCHSSFIAEWSQDVATDLIASLSPQDVIADRDKFGFLIGFLHFLKNQATPCLSEKTSATLMRRILRLAGMEQLVEAKEDFQRLIRTVPPSARIGVELEKNHTELLQVLLADDSDVVFIPKFLEPSDSPSTGRLKTDDCVSVLKRLSKTQAIAGKEKQRESVSKVAAIALSNVMRKSEVVELCGDLPVFVATDCRKRKDGETLVSWNSLNRKREDQTLFVLPPQRAYHLQDALLDECLLLISPDVFSLLFPGVETNPVCSPTQVVNTLTRLDPPTLARSAERKSLLHTMLDFLAGRRIEGYRQSVRYLLHGNPEEYSTDAVLLASSSTSSDIWRRIVVRSLECDETQWRLIDADLAGAMSPERREEFSVQEIDSGKAAEFLASHDPTIFEKLNPNETEYAEMLHSIKEDYICRRLPIHPTIDGQCVAIEDNTFWQSQMAIPPELASTFVTLTLSSDPDTRHRQLRLTRQLDDVAVLKMALDSSQPERHWKLILNATGAIRDIPSDLNAKLANTRWLTMSDGNCVSPCDVIRLPKLHNQLRKIVASCPGIYYEPSQISQKILKHDSFTHLEKHCFADTETSMTIVGELLKTSNANVIGPLSESDYDNWIAAVAEIPEAILPVSAFIHAAAEVYPRDVHALIRELATAQIGRQRIVDLLDAFRNQHRRTTSARRKETLLSVFNLYLTMLLDNVSSVACLEDQQLLSRAGVWTDPTQLAFANDGIADCCVVHEAIEKALERHAEFHSQQGTQGDPADDALDFNWGDAELEMEETGKRLKAYFRPWENAIPAEQIGGFLALLGDAENVKKLSGQYLGGNRTLEQTRRKFGLYLKDKHDAVVEDSNTMISKQRCIVEIASSPRVVVASVLGNRMEAKRNQNPSSIFVGYGRRNLPFPHRMVNGHRVLCFRLNEINVRKLNPSELADLLRDSAVKLILEAYCLPESKTQFSDAWDELAQSDQLDISIAQARIIDNAFLILQQYGLKSDSKLGPVIRAWDAAAKLTAELSCGVPLSDPGSRDANRERDLAKDQLRDLLENDVETHHRIASAVRHRIEKHYQYTIHSIPFEIFQNADDTCSQLAEHFDDPGRTEAARVFRVFRDEHRIVFAHFGRCVNQYPRDKPTLRAKFEDDLWSMLVLNLSSKATENLVEAAKVTGKYGLGFKSCYLVSDSPRVVSGSHGFEVNGAMYPSRMIESGEGEASSISQVRDRLGAGKRHATLIELPMDHATTADVLRRFDQLCGFQVVFARHISSITFDDGSDVSWNPETVTGVHGCFIGSLSIPDAEHSTSRTRALLLRNRSGSLLLNLDADGFTSFDDEVPTIWVMAPTDERLGTGFLVNGSFNIDVGRAQLSRDLSENEQIASELGQQLGQQFAELFERSNDHDSWQSFVAELGLAVDVTQYGLFDSLFEVLCNADDGYSQEPGPKLLHDMIWRDDDSAGSVLVTRVRALPTRLDGPYGVLVSGDEVKFVLSGILETQTELFETVSSWGSFRSKAPIGSVVAKRRVATAMRRLRPQLLAAASPLRLADALQWELGDSLYCDRNLALRLGQVVTRQLIQESDETDEQHELETILRNVKFKGGDGKFHLVGKLLCPNLFDILSDFDSDSGEEAFRAEFAPGSCLLSEEYSGESLVFFDACRGRMEAPARLMADWVVKARDLPRRLASLRYIARGQLRHPLTEALKQIGLTGTWLENLASSEAFGELDESDRWHLRELLPAEEQPTVDWSQFILVQKTSQQLSSADALQAVHDWWSVERNKPQPIFDGRTFLQEFEHRTYPEGSLQNLLGDGSSQRVDWMILFLIGIFHTQGRTRPEQHRSFLRYLKSKGWFVLFASSESNSQEWIRFVEDYVDNQITDATYTHWMRQFVGIFQVNRHLDAYIETFLAIDRFQESFILSDVTVTGLSHHFQGGGVEAPMLSRQLGLGACFVVRELVREGVLKSQHTHAHCFVPTGRVRSLFASLGCEGLEQQNNRWEVSTLIHAFVVDELGDDKASFCDDFDIPFQFIAEDDNLQQQLFHQRLELEDSDEQQSDSDWDAFTP